MPRSCSICRHPERGAIDHALEAREPYRTIAERFETSPAALHRHQQAHTQPPASGGLPGLAAPVTGTALAGEAQRLHEAARGLAYHPVNVIELLKGITGVLVGVTSGETVPAPMARPALVAEAQRLQTHACQLRQGTRELHSIHTPAVLTRIEDIAQLLVQVTGLLIELTTAAE